MSRGVLLDRHGRPEGHASIEELERRMHRADPALRPGLRAILDDLEKSAAHAGPFEPRGSLQSWRECLYSTVADGTAVTAASETILVPDFTLPANYMYQGRTLCYTLFGRMSSVITTPGTFTFRLRWGGVGGVAVCASGAQAPDPTAASTNVAWTCQFYMVCRSIGTSGTALGWGSLWHNDIDDGAAAVASLTAALNNQMSAFPDAAANATIDTTTAKAVSPTVQPSVATGSVTCHHAMLEALN